MSKIVRYKLSTTANIRFAKMVGLALKSMVVPELFFNAKLNICTLITGTLPNYKTLVAIVIRPYIAK